MNITIGQFYNTKSFMHSLDPRTKILGAIIFMVLIFAASSPASYAAVIVMTAIAVAASRVPVRYIFRGLKALWMLLIFTGLLNLFLTKGNGEPLWEWRFLHVYPEGIRIAASMALRLVLLVTGTSLLTLTTSPITLTNGLERVMRPFSRIGFPAHEVAMMMSIALRFIPTLTDEADKIIKAQSARGADFESGGVMARVRALIPILVPLFVSAFRRADELAIAMECRCYHGGEGRTQLHELHYGKRDGVAAAFILVLIAAIVAFKICGV